MGAMREGSERRPVVRLARALDRGLSAVRARDGGVAVLANLNVEDAEGGIFHEEGVEVTLLAK